MTKGRTLQTARRVLSTVIFLLISLYLAGCSVSLTLALGWTSRIQAVPMALSASFGLLLGLLLVTLVFGRLYCSTVCPMGWLQDLFAWLRRRNASGRSRHPYRYRPAKRRLRLSWLLLIVITTLLGASLMLTLFDPYGAYGRIGAFLLRPLVSLFTNAPAVHGTLVGATVAAATLVVVAVFAWRGGRTLCNTVCPVGTLLGIISRVSVFKIDINTDRCVNCRLCEYRCKSHCINLDDHTVDTSRCVVCFDCLTACRHNAISYTKRRFRLSWPLMIRVAPPVVNTASAPGDGKKLMDRRKFIATGIVAAATPAILALDRRLNGDGTPPPRPQLPQPEPMEGTAPAHRPVTPPGIKSDRLFLNRCVGCGACIAACPSKVLLPSARQYGAAYPLRPLKNYDLSYCRYDCNVCTRVCPTGAIEPLTIEEKHQFTVGLASVDADLCVGCGRCARVCPRDTITMQPGDGHRRLAVIDLSGCIGCGECQYVCPVKPIKAIVVNGIQR